MPKVSVIIPSFNHGQYIGEAIESVLNQTYQDFEIVITDDNSTDNSLEIINKYIDNRIKLFVFDKNQGASVAANNCVMNSHGIYIAMLSSDDIFLPNKLEKQVAYLEKNKKIGVVFGFPKMIDNNGLSLPNNLNADFKVLFNKKNRSRYSWLNYFFNYGNCLCHPSALIRRTCYDKVGFYDSRYASLPDFDFWIRICKEYEIYIFQEELIKMRWRDNNANESSFSHENLSRCIWEYKNILRNYLNLPISEFNLVFPDYHISPSVEREQDHVLFQLANISLDNHNMPHKIFAMEILYELMRDYSRVDLINRYYSFYYKDLINIAGKNNMLSENINYLPVKRLFIELVRRTLSSSKRKIIDMFNYLVTINIKLNRK